MDYFLVHTNQHYSQNIDAVFFKELELSQPKYNLGIGSGSHGETTGRMMIGIEDILIKEKPDVVFVQGDTNTVIAGALVASKLGITVGHVEAGLRSYDRTMPEEINRIVTDHVSNFLFCPTEKQANNLLKEGIGKNKIFVSGNTIVDAVIEYTEIAERKSKILSQYELLPDDYILMTSHRPATVDVKKNLQAVFRGVERIAKKNGKRVVFPVHPRTKKMVKKFEIGIPARFLFIDPVGFLDMLKLQRNSFLIVTDSGGLQEESCILGKKCVIIRESTERPEAVEVGGCVLVGNSDSGKIYSEAQKLLRKKVFWHNPFGDGKSGERIVEVIHLYTSPD